MKRNLPLILLTLLSVLVSGCQVFPYVAQATQEAPEILEETTSEPNEGPPTATLIPSLTPTQTPATTAEPAVEAPADPSPTPEPVLTLQEGSPVALPNFNHPEAGCAWLGVAGQVFNEEDHEILGLRVLVGDSANPEADPLEANTGEALAYGLGGYEIQIGEEAADSSERFWIQVLNEAGAPLTARHYFPTFQACEQNLILINFVPLVESDPKAAPTPTLPAYP